MNEGKPLLALNAVPDSIWGDEDETIVYAQAIGNGRPLIFRFALDDSPQSLPTRIVNCYHDNEDYSTPLRFEVRGAMRGTIWSTIATVWPSCIADPRIFEPGTVIDLVSNDADAAGVNWVPYREHLFDKYLDLFRGIQPSELVPQDDQPAPVVDMSQIVVLSAMGGKGCSKQVRVRTESEDASVFAFKGVDFQTYLQVHDDDDKFARDMVDVWRRSSRLIASMPSHPYIQSPPKMLVSVCGVVVGHLSTFLPRGDLAAVIASANSTGTPISLQQKARWSLQMSLAIAHTHGTMQTFHMDIKPGNFLVDDHGNLSLIDWEQSGAPPTTLAPEADGTWDVSEVEVDAGDEQQVASTRLVYTKYSGPERRNMPEGSGQEPFNIWNVFPVWQASCPKASELAEVFALGRTLWMLQTQTIEGFDEINHPDDVQITWGPKDTIPLSWITMAMQCMEKDPNGRPLLADIVKFWRNVLESECIRNASQSR